MLLSSVCKRERRRPMPANVCTTRGSTDHGRLCRRSAISSGGTNWGATQLAEQLLLTAGVHYPTLTCWLFDRQNAPASVLCNEEMPTLLASLEPVEICDKYCSNCHTTSSLYTAAAADEIAEGSLQDAVSSDSTRLCQPRESLQISDLQSYSYLPVSACTGNLRQLRPR